MNSSEMATASALEYMNSYMEVESFFHDMADELYEVYRHRQSDNPLMWSRKAYIVNLADELMEEFKARLQDLSPSSGLSGLYGFLLDNYEIILEEVDWELIATEISKGYEWDDTNE